MLNTNVASLEKRTQRTSSFRSHRRWFRISASLNFDHLWEPPEKYPLQITIIGCGHIGLVSGCCLAQVGHQLLCADKDETKIQNLNAGKLPIYEPYLDGVLACNRNEGRLEFTNDVRGAVRASDTIFICVGAPALNTGDVDLSSIDLVARVIAAESDSPKLVIVRSTVPVQTAQQLKNLLLAYCPKVGITFRVASNPQFHREGTAVEDFFHPDRILLGVEEETAEQQLREIYRPILECRFRCPIHLPACPPFDPPELLIASVNSAELIKHVSNSFLAMKISYANALANLCERLGADIEEVTRAIGLDQRIGPQFLRPGLGFGGSRLPQDIRTLIRLSERAGMDFALLKEAERVNEQRVDHLLEKIRHALWVIQEKEIGVLGLAFKPNTDDIRFSPAVGLIRRLLAEGASVRAFDPQAMEKSRAVFPGLVYGADPYSVAKGADALLIATEWEEFRHLDWERIRESMARSLVFDGRNLLSPAEMKALGFEYYCIGRPAWKPDGSS